MSYQINPTAVASVVREVNAVLQGRKYNTGEVMIGLSEMLARVVVESCQTPVHAMDAMKVITDHLDRTLKAGYSAKGFNMEGRSDG